MIPIKGLEKTSLVDYVPYTVSTIFIAGCNFRCPFCHNPELVEPSGPSPSFTEDMIIDFLRSRQKWLDGVCITGGEPTLFPELVGFIKRIRDEGMLVKLDTNGTNPDMLRELCDNKLVDYIAMDIKNSPERYEETAGASVRLDDIKKSIEIIKNSPVDHEFRTTLVPRFHTKEDVEKIRDWMSGSKRFMLQRFRSTNVNLLDKDLEGEAGFSDEEMSEFSELLKEKIDEVEIKN
jgi:pyruvate formate lyase activating enzyme